MTNFSNASIYQVSELLHYGPRVDMVDRIPASVVYALQTIHRRLLDIAMDLEPRQACRGLLQRRWRNECSVRRAQHQRGYAVPDQGVLNRQLRQQALETARRMVSHPLYRCLGARGVRTSRVQLASIARAGTICHPGDVAQAWGVREEYDRAVGRQCARWERAQAAVRNAIPAPVAGRWAQAAADKRLHRWGVIGYALRAVDAGIGRAVTIALDPYLRVDAHSSRICDRATGHRLEAGDLVRMFLALFPGHMAACDLRADGRVDYATWDGRRPARMRKLIGARAVPAAPVEIVTRMRAAYHRATRRRYALSKSRYGIEIETTVSVAEVDAQGGVPCYSNWIVEADSSINCLPGEWGVELVSPPTAYATLQTQVAALQVELEHRSYNPRGGAKRVCGLHVTSTISADRYNILKGWFSALPASAYGEITGRMTDESRRFALASGSGKYSAINVRKCVGGQCLIELRALVMRWTDVTHRLALASYWMHGDYSVDGYTMVPHDATDARLTSVYRLIPAEYCTRISTEPLAESMLSAATVES